MQAVPARSSSAFETLVSERIGALVVSGENFFLTQRGLMVELAARHAVPTIYAAREFVLAGGLMSYGTPQVDAVRQVGVSTGRILKGEKAADLPVQQVTKIQLAINLKTAKALGLNIPQHANRTRRRGDRVAMVMLRCVSPLLALSGHARVHRTCPLLGVERT